MTTANYQRILADKVKELRRSQVAKEDISIERNAEVLDEIQRTADREIALSTLSRNWKTASEVNEALERIAAGVYGICEECEEPIGERRLNAIPWAKLCIRCQSKEDAANAAGLRDAA